MPGFSGVWLGPRHLAFGPPLGMTGRAQMLDLRTVVGELRLLGFS